MTRTSTAQTAPGPSTARFSMTGVAGRRLRVGQWHADRGGVPLVMLGGIGMNMELLEPVAQAMPHRWLVSVDMPGVGQSPDPVFPYTIGQMALALAAVLDRLQIDVADVLGISWGGALAQQFAFAHRARSRRLVLAATSAGAMMVPGNPAMIGHMLDPMEFTVASALRRNLAALYNGGGTGQVSLNAATPPSPAGWACQISAFAAWSSAAFLPLLSLPVLVMADTDDHLIPVTNAQLLHAAIPGSRLDLSSGGGHLFMLASPQAFAVTLDDFLG